MEVINGDALTVKTSDGTLKKVFLASVRPPRAQNVEASPEGTQPTREAARRSRPLYDIPYMFEAREFLRKKLIGKKVRQYWKIFSWIAKQILANTLVKSVYVFVCLSSAKRRESSSIWIICLLLVYNFIILTSQALSRWINKTWTISSSIDYMNFTGTTWSLGEVVSECRKFYIVSLYGISYHKGHLCFTKIMF